MPYRTASQLIKTEETTKQHTIRVKSLGLVEEERKKVMNETTDGGSGRGQIRRYRIALQIAANSGNATNLKEIHHSESL